MGDSDQHLPAETCGSSEILTSVLRVFTAVYLSSGSGRKRTLRCRSNASLYRWLNSNKCSHKKLRGHLFLTSFSSVICLVWNDIGISSYISSIGLKFIRGPSQLPSPNSLHSYRRGLNEIYTEMWQLGISHQLVEWLDEDKMQRGATRDWHSAYSLFQRKLPHRSTCWTRAAWRRIDDPRKHVWHQF